MFPLMNKPLPTPRIPSCSAMKSKCRPCVLLWILMAESSPALEGCYCTLPCSQLGSRWAVHLVRTPGRSSQACDCAFFLDCAAILPVTAAPLDLSLPGGCGGDGCAWVSVSVCGFSLEPELLSFWILFRYSSSASRMTFRSSSVAYSLMFFSARSRSRILLPYFRGSIINSSR